MRNELRLAGDAHTYTLDATQFHPALPTQLYENGRTVLWVDQGTAQVVAITLYDQNDANPTKATTPAYDHPTLAMQALQQRAEVISGASIALLLGALGWAVVLLRGLRRQQSAFANAGRMRSAQPERWR